MGQQVNKAIQKLKQRVSELEREMEGIDARSGGGGVGGGSSGIVITNDATPSNSKGKQGWVGIARASSDDPTFWVKLKDDDTWVRWPRQWSSTSLPGGIISGDYWIDAQENLHVFLSEALNLSHVE